MAVLLDTNILVRLSNTADAMHFVASYAVTTLRQRGETLWITPQVLIEFRSVATRPASANGLGLSSVHAKTKALSFEFAFPIVGRCTCDFSSLEELG